ncbi:uncharacterized protein PRCAT00005268001 [Priceomyces carsonii]|uniref:uncharacterized protein n=1 Tax=Priceomyces carsonii TaxID=28549 RepID=UPI002EDBB104|nr:unnamed protein product [Priceomyces carsonii]
MDIHKQLLKFDYEQSFTSLVSSLETNGISTVDLLLFSLNDRVGSVQLSKKLGRSIREVDDFLGLLSQEFARNILSNSVVDLRKSKDALMISTGLPHIDRQLRGGIRFGEITEIFGASGCGKSQLLLQLLVNMHKQSPQSLGIYISTEAPLETRRLKEMSTFDSTFMSRVSSIYCQDLETQDHVIFTQLPIELERTKGNTKLVLIDSIAHHLRREDLITNLTYLENRVKEQELEFEDDKYYNEVKERHRKVMKSFFKSTARYEKWMLKTQYIALLHKHLTKLAQTFNISIVVANQVSDHTDSNHDLLSYDGISYPLNLDMQLGFFSGWDNKTILEYHRSMIGEHSVYLKNFTDHFTQILLTTRSRNKRQRLDGTAEASPKSKALCANIEDESQLTSLLQIESSQTKKYVPALGYQWNKLISTRIMLMKSYQPVFHKNRLNINGISDINMTARNSNSSSQDYEDAHILKNLIDGWEPRRYMKVISNLVDVSNCSNYYKIPFSISTTGLIENRN